jgi:hypothetical protein
MVIEAISLEKARSSLYFARKSLAYLDTLLIYKGICDFDRVS